MLIKNNNEELQLPVAEKMHNMVRVVCINEVEVVNESVQYQVILLP